MSITAEFNTDDMTIDVRCPVQMVDKVRALPGSRVRKDDDMSPVWWFPVSYAAAYMLRSEFGDRIEFGPNLTSWVRHFYETKVVPAFQFRYAEDAEAPWGTSEERAQWLRGYQRTGAAFMLTVKGSVCADEMGTGKGQSPDTPILTPSGWSTYGEISVGDEVVSVDGTPARVSGVFPRGEQPCFRVTFSDRTSTIVDSDHLWEVNTPTRIHRGDGGKVLSTSELAQQDLRDGAGNRKWFIPLSRPVQHPFRTLPVDPYLLGLLLGDGSMARRNILLTSADEEILDAVQRLTDGTRGEDRKGNGTVLVGKGSVDTATRDLGVRVRSEEKFVPGDYLVGSISQRLALLQGLMDSDGTVSPSRRGASFTSTSEALVDAVASLARSLGGRATVSDWRTTTHSGGVKGQPSKRVHLDTGNIVPFRLTRKVDAYLSQQRQGPPTIAIESVERVSPRETICIAVEHERSLYVTEHYKVTHNTDQVIETIETQARLHEADPENYADPFPVLLVVPEAVRRQWKRAWQNEANHAYPEREIAVADGTAAQRRKEIERIKNGEADVLVIGYSVMRKHSRLINYGSITLRRCEVCDPEGSEGRRQVSCDWCEKELNEIEWGALAADEAHLLKNPSAKQTRAVWWINEKQMRPGALRIAATGTPTESQLDDMWGVLHLVQPSEFPVKQSFLERFALMVPRGDGGLEIAGVNPMRKDEYHAITDHFIIRRLKEVVQPYLPPKIYEDRDAYLSPKQKRSYKNVEKDLMVRALTDDTDETRPEEAREMPAIEPAVASLRLQQAAAATLDVQECETCEGSGEAKQDVAHDPEPHPDPDWADTHCWCAKPLDWQGPEHRNICRACNGWGDTVELVEPSAKLDVLMDLLTDELKGKQVVVFYRFLRLANLLADRLDKEKKKKGTGDLSYFRFDGSTSSEEREVGLRQFEVGQTRLALVSIDAGGTGVDGLQQADTAVYLQRHPSRIRDTQSEDRLHRGGAEKHESVLYLDIIADVDIEAEQRRSRARKDENFEDVINDAQTLRNLIA